MRNDSEEHNGSHGGMNHGMGGMVLGCLVPMAAIVLLPRFGVSPTAAIVIGIVGMVALHGGMMYIPRLWRRRAREVPQVPQPVRTDSGHQH